MILREYAIVAPLKLEGWGLRVCCNGSSLHLLATKKEWGILNHGNTQSRVSFLRTHRRNSVSGSKEH
ncbi:MAG: hypothetical protein WCW78_00445, partial [Candidatus Paceibacterota bacterium]